MFRHWSSSLIWSPNKNTMNLFRIHCGDIKSPTILFDLSFIIPTQNCGIINVTHWATYQMVGIEKTNNRHSDYFQLHKNFKISILITYPSPIKYWAWDLANEFTFRTNVVLTDIAFFCAPTKIQSLIYLKITIANNWIVTFSLTFVDFKTYGLEQWRIGRGEHGLYYFEPYSNDFVKYFTIICKSHSYMY